MSCPHFTLSFQYIPRWTDFRFLRCKFLRLQWLTIGEMQITEMRRATPKTNSSTSNFLPEPRRIGHLLPDFYLIVSLLQFKIVSFSWRPIERYRVTVFHWPSAITCWWMRLAGLSAIKPFQLIPGGSRCQMNPIRLFQTRKTQSGLQSRHFCSSFCSNNSRLVAQLGHNPFHVFSCHYLDLLHSGCTRLNFYQLGRSSPAANSSDSYKRRRRSTILSSIQAV